MLWPHDFRICCEDLQRFTMMLVKAVQNPESFTWIFAEGKTHGRKFKSANIHTSQSKVDTNVFESGVIMLAVYDVVGNFFSPHFGNLQGVFSLLAQKIEKNWKSCKVQLSLQKLKSNPRGLVSTQVMEFWKQLVIFGIFWWIYAENTDVSKILEICD